MCCRLLALAITLLGLFVGCSIKSQFIELAYPDSEIQAPPERDWTLSVAATLVPLLTIGYDHPPAVGSCLEQLPLSVDDLWSYGQCLATSHNTEETCGDVHIWQLVWRKEENSLTPRCSAAVGRPDQLRMALAIMDVGEAIYSYNSSITGRLDAQEPLDDRIQTAVESALRVAIQTLKADPRASKPRPGTLPTLSLSGGAANGAFTAGYLYALLLTREAAISRAIRESDTDRLARIEHRERFEAAVGTSAGTLAALPVDLYFSDNARVTEHSREALERCLATTGGSEPFVDASRPVQRCALGRLRTDFIQDEWNLLCVVDGSVLGLFDHITGALRFDPLLKDFLQPFLADFSELMLHNDFIRVAMAIDLRQNVLIGLDERVCRWSEINTAQCLSTGILASIVEPVFAEPVQRVFSGVHGREGEAGTWIDGGLRSGTPASRAVTLTRVSPAGKDAMPTRVLAVNTHRAEGIVSRPPPHAISVLFGSIGAIVEQTRLWEMAYAQRLDPRRQERLCLIERNLRTESLFCPQLTAHVAPREVTEAFPQLGVGDAVLPIFIPEDINPPELFAEGYTFDPVIMKGLFLWGQRVFLENYRSVLNWLGWEIVLRLVALSSSGTDHSAIVEMTEAVNSELIALQSMVAAPDWWQRRRQERRRQLRQRLKQCK